MTPPREPVDLDALRRAVEAAARPHQASGAQIAVTARGVTARRSEIAPAGFRAIEDVLSASPVRVLDFNHGPQDLAESYFDGERYRDDYAGAVGAGGAPVFRVDHHHPCAALRAASTTPLVRRWLLGLHRAGARQTLSVVASGRYLVNHWDVDILFAQHLADAALDAAYLEGAGEVLAAAALRNDYLLAPPSALRERALDAYFAGLGLEDAITRGEVSFDEALARWVPAIGRLVLSEPAPPAERARLGSWRDGAARAERDQLDEIDRWATQGRLKLERGGRLAVLDAPRRIDNAVLFLYLRERLPLEGRRVQLLHYPDRGGRRVYKLRSHGGLDLHPAFEMLRVRLPNAGFGGRSTAGGSRPTEPCIEEVRRVLEGLLDGP